MADAIARRDLIAAAGACAAGAVAASALTVPGTARADEAVADVPSWLGTAPEVGVEDCDETVEADVVVLGAAASGSTAGFSAARSGAKTVIIDKNKTYHAGGSALTFINSKHQLEAGEPEFDMQKVIWQVIGETQNRADCGLWGKWAAREAEICDILIDEVAEPTNLNVDYSIIDADLREGFNGIHDTCLYFASRDVDRFSPFLDSIHTVFERLGGEIHYERKGEKLVQDESGAVTGVIASRPDGGYTYYHAPKGVIVCTGGIGSNKEMMEAFYSPKTCKIPIAYNAYMDPYDLIDDPLDTGDGHKMMCWAGAEMEEATHAAVGWQYTGMVGSPYLMLNKAGKRFTNECIFFLNDIQQIIEQPYDEETGSFYAWQVVTDEETPMRNNSGIPDPVLDVIRETGDWISADTVEELAEAINVDPAVLAEEIERYNALCEQGFDEDFGKDAQYMIPLKTPPFQAVKATWLMAATLGGVKTDNRARVITAEGLPIPGLYAAGNTVGRRFGWAYEASHLGLSNSMALVYGFIAGEEAAQR